MKVRNPEVLDLLREEPELLAIADAVAETQRAPRRSRPSRTVLAVILAAASLFVLVLASPWEHGGGRGLVLDRALAAIDSRGTVVHAILQFDITSGKATPPSTTTEVWYDSKQRLERVVTRSEGKLLADYTRPVDREELRTFVGLLEQAGFYREALANGKAKVLDKGLWQGRPIYWIEVTGGGPGTLRIGIDRHTYRPVVFRSFDAQGHPNGFQIAVVGFGYVSPAEASFQTIAGPLLVSGTVTDQSCRPVQGRVAVMLSPDNQVPEGQPQVQAEVASVTTGPDGRFELTADPAKSPFREALVKAVAQNDGWLNFDLTAMRSQSDPRRGGFAFFGFSRFLKGGEWRAGEKAQPEIPSRVNLQLITDRPGGPAARHC